MVLGWVLSAQQATVIRVIDGDTFEVRLRNNHKYNVRLLGVDSPELAKGKRVAQPFANEAKAFSEQQLLGKIVQLSNDGKKNAFSFNRRLVYINIDGNDYGEMLLTAGMARAYRKQHKATKTPKYILLEEEAKVNKRGLWNVLKMED